jgi:hypothetical protein
LICLCISEGILVDLEVFDIAVYIRVLLGCQILFLEYLLQIYPIRASKYWQVLAKRCRPVAFHCKFCDIANLLCNLLENFVNQLD